MTDVHAPEARQRNMAAIRANNTRPELIARRGLHSLGYRFRLHVRDLPGRPDIVLPKHRAVIFINGCFFHGHDCSYFKWPSTRADFWRTKIKANQMRDAQNLLMLHRAGWRVLTIWECALRGAHGKRQEAIEAAARWLTTVEQQGDIRMSAPGQRCMSGHHPSGA